MSSWKHFAKLLFPLSMETHRCTTPDNSTANANWNENSQPSLMMPIIQFVMPSRNKQLKKLLHFYWEVCPKYDENGKLKQEMILVVYVLCLSTFWLLTLEKNLYRNAIRNDLVRNLLVLMSPFSSYSCLATPQRIHSWSDFALSTENRK